MSRFDAWHRATKRGYNDGISVICIVRAEALEEAAWMCEKLARIADMTDTPYYEGDDRPTVRRTALALARIIRGLKEGKR